MATFQVTTSADAGPGSFRQAILDNDSTSGTNTIDFAIAGSGVHSIALSTPLPAINNPAIVDATTQPGYNGTPLIELNGANIYLPGVTPPTLQPGVIGLVLSGGVTTVKGLTIDRFTGEGIYATGDGNTIAANFIGTDPTGTRSVANGADGIVINSRNNLIGGSDSSSRNLISGNAGLGIYLGSSSSLPANNRVEGNFIGTDLTGSVDLGNGRAGVDVESSSNTIGGVSASLGNLIEDNGGPGVQVGNYSYQSNVNQNRITNNQIFGNVGLGIDLGDDGVTFNNSGNLHYGPNNSVNFPNLTSAYTATGGGTTVEGSLVGSPNSEYTIDYYVSPSEDPSGYGQGLTPISSRTVATDANGHVDLTSTLPTNIPVNQVVSATSTDSLGDTSEFSQALVVSPTPHSHLNLAASQSNPSAAVNVPQTYSYFVRNDGPSLATNTSFVDILPVGATFLYGTSSQGTVLASNGTVTTNLGSLTDGTTATITLTFSLATSGSVLNTGKVTADQNDPNPVNDTLNQYIQVNPAPPVDLNITGAVAPVPSQVGDDLTYTFIVTNQSFGDQASGVIVSDPLPKNVTFVSATSSQGTATQVNGVVTANLGVIPGGANATVTVVVQPAGTGLLSNTATVKGNETDYNSINNSVTVDDFIAPAPTIDLSVNVTAAPTAVSVGQDVTYVVIVTNHGNATATEVALINQLPDSASIVSVRTSQGTAALSGVTLSTAIGTLAPGASAAVTIILQPGAAGLIVDQASVSADQTDFNIADNVSSNATNVVADFVGPVLINQRLTVSHRVITSIVLSFNKALDPILAVDPSNYAIADLGSKSSLTTTGSAVGFTVFYDPITRSVTLTPKKGLAIGRFYKLVLNGPNAVGLTDTSGNVLDGVRNGLQNTAYVALIGRGTINRPISIQIGANIPHPYPTQGTVKSTSHAHSASNHIKAASIKPAHNVHRARSH